jgi:hypothetical protein
MAWRLPILRSVSPAVAALLLVAAAWALSAHSPDDRRVLVVSAFLTLLEVAIVAAVAVVFSAFSSPFLTALLTLGVFIAGRSADSLARLPARLFGEVVSDIAAALSRLFPNLMLYVPSRALLTGESASSGAFGYVGMAAVQAAGWVLLLVALASAIFKRRDLT